MAIGTAHLALKHGVMVRQAELQLFVAVARKTGRGISSRVNDIPPAAGLIEVATGRPLAHLAALYSRF